MRNLLFGDYLCPDLEGDERLYFEVSSLQVFNDVVELCLDEYNQTHKRRMNLVIFRCKIYLKLVFYLQHSYAAYLLSSSTHLAYSKPH